MGMQPSLLIRHTPISRRRRMARMRAAALATIGAVAVLGVGLQALERQQPAGAQVAANPGAFDYFPG